MIFFHETELWGKGLLKVLFFVKKNDQILNFKKKFFLNFFQRIYSAPSLILEKISIFHQSLRWMFWMIIVNLIGVLPHAGYQNVSPGLGEPISGNKSANRPFPAKLNYLYFTQFSSILSSESQKLADIVNLAGRSADLAKLKRISRLFSLWKHSKSRTTLISSWVIFIYFWVVSCRISHNPEKNGAIL